MVVLFKMCIPLKSAGEFTLFRHIVQQRPLANFCKQKLASLHLTGAHDSLLAVFVVLDWMLLPEHRLSCLKRKARGATRFRCSAGMCQWVLLRWLIADKRGEFDVFDINQTGKL